MIAPDHGRTDAVQTREDFREDRTWRRSLGRGIFAVTVIAIAYLTLMPNYGRTRFRIVPIPLYRWLAAPEQDWFVNVVAFGFLAVVVFIAGENSAAGGESKSVGIFARRGARLAALLALVCVIEIVQIWIPGRTSSLEDVCFGWSGILAAWLLAVLRDPRAENAGCK